MSIVDEAALTQTEQVGVAKEDIDKLREQMAAEAKALAPHMRPPPPPWTSRPRRSAARSPAQKAVTLGRFKVVQLKERLASKESRQAEL